MSDIENPAELDSRNIEAFSRAIEGAQSDRERDEIMEIYSAWLSDVEGRDLAIYNRAMALIPGDKPKQEIVIDQTPALAKREPRQIAQFTAGGPLAAMIPQTPAEYAKMANLLIDASCIPASYESRAIDQDQKFRETRAKLIIGLMKSVEIGVPPITGLNGIMIVNNRPSCWGDLAMALIQRGGQLEKHTVETIGSAPAPNLPIDQWDSTYGYRVTMWRKGQDEPYVGEFTVGNARRAQLWLNTKKQPWILYPDDMLFNRARSKPMRRGFSDYLHGMGIVEEERDLAQEVEAKPSVAALLED